FLALPCAPWATRGGGRFPPAGASGCAALHRGRAGCAAVSPRLLDYLLFGAALTPSRVAKEVSLAVSRKSRIKGESSISARIPANSVANRPFSPRRRAVT